MTNNCQREVLNVINEAIRLPRGLVIHTASAISFVLYREKSQSKTMKHNLGIYVTSLTICSL